MRKTITPVVSVILLVLMTVGASALAFFWVSNVQASVQESAGTAISDAPVGCSESSCNYVMFTGDITRLSNDYCPCCGDDGTNDVFYNSTHMCSYGGVLFDVDGLYTQDWLGDYMNYSSGKGVCEFKDYDWMVGNGTFVNILNKSTGMYPDNIISGDFDNDGNLDIVVNLWSDETISFFSGDGSGGFANSVDKYAGTHLDNIVSGDFDGDGNLDIITLDYNDDFFSFFSGDGSGGFSDAVTKSTGDGPKDVISGDFDNDGNLDIVITEDRDYTVSFFSGDGSGGFSDAVTKSTNYVMDSIVSGDFNKDGNLDIIVNNQNNNTFSFFSGDGSGGFADPVAKTSSGFLWDVGSGDFDGDGNLDVVTIDSDSYILSFFSGDGSGGFSDGVDKFTTNPPKHLISGDFDGDGNLDVITLDSDDDAFSFFSGDGSGGFANAVTKSTGNSPQDIYFGDFDKDGDIDIVNSNSLDDTFSYFENIGISGTNGPCCGDDSSSDDFYNSTDYCCDGVLNTGSCHCGDGVCSSWEENGVCVADCGLDITQFSDNSTNKTVFFSGSGSDDTVKVRLLKTSTINSAKVRITGNYECNISYKDTMGSENSNYWGVDTGDVDPAPGNEIIASRYSSSSDDARVDIFYSNTSFARSIAVENPRGIAVGEFNSGSSGNEILISNYSSNEVLVYSSAGSYLDSISVKLPQGIALGELNSSSSGVELAVADEMCMGSSPTMCPQTADDKVLIFGQDKTNLFNISGFSCPSDVAIGEFNQSSEGNEIGVVDYGNELVKIFDKNGNQLMQLSIIEPIGIEIAEVNTSSVGNELIITNGTSMSGSVLIFDSQGNLLKIKYNDLLMLVTTGEVTNTDNPGDEIIVANYGEGCVYYIDVYKTHKDDQVTNSPSLDVGSDSDTQWSYSGDFTVSELTSDFTAELNSFIPDCTCTGCSSDGDYCIIDLEMSSTSAGTITLSNLLINYS